MFLCLLACPISFWMPAAFPVVCPLLAHVEQVISQGFVMGSLIPGDPRASVLDAQCLGSLSPSHQRELGLEAGAAARLWRALGQHGDLGAEVGAVAAQGRVVVLHVRAQEPLQVPPPPLPLELSLDLDTGKTGKAAQGITWGCSDLMM